MQQNGQTNWSRIAFASIRVLRLTLKGDVIKRSGYRRGGEQEETG